MSKEAINQFREAINDNEEWQEEVKNFGDDDSMATYASGKGYEFTQEEYIEYTENSVNGELSLFEMEMVVGGRASKGKLARRGSRKGIQRTSPGRGLRGLGSSSGSVASTKDPVRYRRGLSGRGKKRGGR